MIYLIDNQLPVALAKYLQEHGLESVHVSDCGLNRASDREIWDYAKNHGCIIISKDEDFFHLSGSDPTGPPVVWVRLGNCRNPAIFRAFEGVIVDLVEAIAAGAKLVEIR